MYDPLSVICQCVASKHPLGQTVTHLLQPMQPPLFSIACRCHKNLIFPMVCRGHSSTHFQQAVQRWDENLGGVVCCLVDFIVVIDNLLMVYKCEI